MAGGAKAVSSGDELKDLVSDLGTKLGLETRQEYKVARRIWGAERRIDVILKNPANAKTLGVECKFQGGGGSAEEKVPATIQDISAWPIDGIVVFGGDGFSSNMLAYFHSTGKAVALDDLEAWLRL